MLTLRVGEGNESERDRLYAKTSLSYPRNRC